MTNQRRLRRFTIPVFIASAIVAHPIAAADYIAGLTPNQRPASAPRIADAPPRDGADSPALYGVTQPIPPTLKFLHDQGNWYTPFDRPGMSGPYDIRGWHSNPTSAGKH